MKSRVRIDATVRIDSDNCTEDCWKQIPSVARDFHLRENSFHQDTMHSADHLEPFHRWGMEGSSADLHSGDKSPDSRLETTLLVTLHQMTGDMLLVGY